MRSILLFVTIFLFTKLNAQNGISIQEGTQLTYSINLNGQVFDYGIQLISGGEAYLLKWTSPDGNSGWYSMPESAFENGNRAFWGPAESFDTTRLENDQTIACFSKAFYQELVSKKSAIYDGIKFILKESADAKIFKLENNLVDAIHAISEDGVTKVWLLNDPEVPLLLEMSGNKYGPDAVLKGVK